VRTPSRFLLSAVGSLILAAPPLLAAPALAAPALSAPASGPSSPAADLRVNLDRLLAEHAFLTIEEMRSGLTGEPDFASAAKAVEGNTTDIANAIGLIYGPNAIGPFGDLWRSHIGNLVDYAGALGKGDQAGQQRALDGLATFRVNFRALLTSLNPGVDLTAINDALDVHTAQLLEFVNAEHGGDHARSYAIEREAYPHMFMVGDALAKVIASEHAAAFPGLDVAYSAAGSLRVSIDQLLGEHMFLAGEALRGGLTDAPWSDAARQALDANSQQVADLVKAAYGEEAASAFLGLWRGHVTAYLSYIDGVKANDATSKQASIAQINGYAGQLATFLADANPNLDRGAVTDALQVHAGHLVRQVDAYAAADYDGAYALLREGYGHMFMIGETLASAIATQMPKKFPGLAVPPNTATLPDTPTAVPLVVTVAVAAGLVAGAWAVLVVLSTGRPNATTQRGDEGRRGSTTRDRGVDSA
jgi:hypothetical protein